MPAKAWTDPLVILPFISQSTNVHFVASLGRRFFALRLEENQGKKKFMFIHFYAPHSDYTPPALPVGR